MIRIGNLIILVVASIFCISCSSVYHMTIETQQPAKITFPNNVSSVVVVNNAIAQPEDFGSEFYFINKRLEERNQLVYLDTALWICAYHLSRQIQDADFFSQVLISEESTRSDRDWMSIKQIPENVKTQILEDSGTDAIISVDRVIFEYTQKILPRYENDSDPYVNAIIKINLSCGAYIEGKEKPLTSFTIADSVRFSDLVFNDSLVLYKELPASLIDEGLFVICQKAADYFTPSWSMADRVLYSNQFSRMREALNSATKDNWKQAHVIWTDLYENEKKSTKRARLANNLAVSFEIQDDLETALEWAEKSRELYQLTPGKNVKEIDDINSYINALQKRMIDGVVLDAQQGGK